MNKAFYLSATQKSSGKTTISCGLARAFSRQGHVTQTFKKGPDYIDPIWLRSATGRPCYNLDYWTQSKDEINRLFAIKAQNADLAFVEGNKGLFDGMDLHGSDANAALAKQLQLPVVLVVNTQGITRGIAPLLMGYQEFDTGIDYAGVVLNRVAGPRHEEKLIKAVNQYTDFAVLGSVYNDRELTIDERHLGLMPSNEFHDLCSERLIERLADSVEQQLDLAHFLSQTTYHFPVAPADNLALDSDALSFRQDQPLRIAYPNDAAFGFYYPDDLEKFTALGASLVPFDALHDRALPDGIDGLFLGGGFPEMHLPGLAENQSMLASIKQFIADNKPCYAECGGLMYLCRSIEYAGQCHGMVGAIPAAVVMTDKPVGRGYARIEAKGDHPWYQGEAGASHGKRPMGAHEFHYSKLNDLPREMSTVYQVVRGTGIAAGKDGIRTHNTVANYIHQRHTEQNPWVEHFINFVREHKHHESDGKSG